MLSIIIFLIVLSLLVLVHEFGHFWVARRVGIWVEEFGLGIPPRAWGKKLGETLYSLNWLPFGGFVRLHGENSEEGVSKPSRAFVNKSKKARAAVVSAGVVMNILLAVVCFAIVYSITGIPREGTTVKIVGIAEQSPAAEAGLLLEDEIRSINGTEVSSTQQFIDLVDEAEEINIVIGRGDETVEISTTKRENPPEGEGKMGVVISTAETYYPPLLLRPFYGIYYGFKEAMFWGLMIVQGFIAIFSSLFQGQAPQGVAGPVGIYAITTEAARFGFVTLVNFIGIFSLNLAILNIIPFPALDGGRLLFIIIEALFGRKVLPKVEPYIHMAGMAVLIILLLAITVGDINRLITHGGNITAFLDSLAP